jgi:hypothetical protein
MILQYHIIYVYDSDASKSYSNSVPEDGRTTETCSERLIKLIKIMNYLVNSCVQGLLFFKFLINTLDAYEYDFQYLGSLYRGGVMILMISLSPRWCSC